MSPIKSHEGHGGLITNESVVQPLRRGVVMRLPSPAMATAIAALTVSLGGTAVAVGTRVGGDKLIKKHSLSGNRLRNHTLTGDQLDLLRLGKVPSAKKADTATSADSAKKADTATSADSANTAGHAITADTATSADSANTAGHAITADTATSAGGLPALTWTPLTLTHGWVDENAGGSRTVAVALDAQGIVHLRGLIRCSTYPTTSCVGAAATLPPAFVPDADVFVPVTTVQDTTGDAFIHHHDGTLNIGAPTYANAEQATSLDGMTYALG